jgi:CubicO group peptidase (beta-lactamase class C family)
LKRSDLVDSRLPVLAGANGTAKVTLGMLVSHHSGLASMPTNLPQKVPYSPAEGYTFGDFKTYLFGLPAPVEAGKAYQYSNAGIGLLGLVLEQQLGVTGNHELLNKTLLADLAITELWGEVDRIPSTASARVAKGYAVAGQARVEGRMSRMGVLAGAGEVAASGNAMLTLLKALCGQQASALDAAIAESLTPIKPIQGNESIAYGIEVEQDGSGLGPIFRKSGATAGGYSAYVAFRRNPAVGVAVMTNVAQLQSVKAIAYAILDKLAMTQ